VCTSTAVPFTSCPRNVSESSARPARSIARITTPSRFATAEAIISNRPATVVPMERRVDIGALLASSLDLPDLEGRSGGVRRVWTRRATANR